MLPEALSTRATSLLESQDRLSVVIEFVVAADGAVQSSDVYRAVVRNTAQLTYDGVGAWLERSGPAPRQGGGVIRRCSPSSRLQDACGAGAQAARDTATAR